MRVGLVLGAGGVMGGAWLTGGLAGARRARPAGTRPAPSTSSAPSAGSMIGGLLAAGVPPWFMVAHSAGETFEGLTGADGRPAADGRPRRRRRLPAPPRPAAARPRLAAQWRSPRYPTRSRHTPLSSPAGCRAGSSRPSRSRTRPPRGAERLGRPPEHWVVACDYATGRRVAVRPPRRARRRARRRRRRLVRDPRLLPPGRRSAAAATSTAALWSASNLDILARRAASTSSSASTRLVELAPDARVEPRPSASPRDWLGAPCRGRAARQRGEEAARQRAPGSC